MVVIVVRSHLPSIAVLTRPPSPPFPFNIGPSVPATLPTDPCMRNLADGCGYQERKGGIEWNRMSEWMGYSMGIREFVEGERLESEKWGGGKWPDLRERWAPVRRVMSE